MGPAEILSNAIAGIALFLSWLGWRRDKQAEKIAHEFDLFRDTYKEHLVKKLPEARSRICVTPNGEVEGVETLIEELNAIRKDSLYFQFAEPHFFEELRNKLWALEDYFILLDDPLVEDARQDFEYEMPAKISEIYKCILKRF